MGHHGNSAHNQQLTVHALLLQARFPCGWPPFNAGWCRSMLLSPIT